MGTRPLNSLAPWAPLDFKKGGLGAAAWTDGLGDRSKWNGHVQKQILALVLTLTPGF